MLISPEYAAQNAWMHEKKPQYGTSGAYRLPEVIELINKYGPETLLDYGCGKATLCAALLEKAKEIGGKITVQNYDPAIPAYMARPHPSDFVICSDVLEHIEPEFLDEVLGDIKSLTNVFAYFIIALCPAEKHLPDGRNAHLIVQPVDWWLTKLEKEWNIWKKITEKHCLKLVLSPR